MLPIFLKFVGLLVLSSCVSSEQHTWPPTLEDTNNKCLGTSIGCYYLADSESKCASNSVVWLAQDDSSRSDTNLEKYLPPGLDPAAHYCFRAFTEEEIRNIILKDDCASPATRTRAFMYIENEVIFLQARFRCASVTGLKWFAPEVDWPKHIRIYKELCQRWRDLGASFESELAKAHDDDQKKEITGRMNDSGVKWGREACQPYVNEDKLPLPDMTDPNRKKE